MHFRHGCEFGHRALHGQVRTGLGTATSRGNCLTSARLRSPKEGGSVPQGPGKVLSTACCSSEKSPFTKRHAGGANDPTATRPVRAPPTERKPCFMWVAPLRRKHPKMCRLPCCSYGSIASRNSRGSGESVKVVWGRNSHASLNGYHRYQGWESPVAPWVKDPALALLWPGFDPWLGSSRTPQACQRNKRYRGPHPQRPESLILLGDRTCTGRKCVRRNQSQGREGARARLSSASGPQAPTEADMPQWGRLDRKTGQGQEAGLVPGMSARRSGKLWQGSV